MFRLVAFIIWCIYLFLIFIFIPFFCKKVDNFFIFQMEFSSLVKSLGILLILLGIILGMWCVIVLWKKGNGTPSFLYPPKKLVITGPYKYSRNPMTLAAWLIFIGESIILQSISLFIFFLFIVIPVSILWIIKYEEPFLEKNFGDLYRNYKKSVKRWINLRI